MKISDIRASLQRLAERLDNQWAYARSDAEMDIAAGRAEYNDDGERLPTEPEISYYGMIAAFETLGGFLLSEFRRIPASGESLEYGGLTFQIEEATDRSILWVRVTPKAVAEPSA